MSSSYFHLWFANERKKNYIVAIACVYIVRIMDLSFMFTWPKVDFALEFTYPVQCCELRLFFIAKEKLYLIFQCKLLAFVLYILCIYVFLLLEICESHSLLVDFLSLDFKLDNVPKENLYFPFDVYICCFCLSAFTVSLLCIFSCPFLSFRIFRVCFFGAACAQFVNDFHGKRF